MYALVINAQILSEGPTPTGARRLDTGAWVTPSGGVWDPAVAAACGYLPVTDAARPADTAGTTWDRTLVLVAGVPTVVWVERAKTAGEVSAEQAAAARAANRATVAAIVDDLQAEKARVQPVLDATNATINAGPAPYLRDTARAAKRIADAAIDLARYVKDL